MLSVVFLYILSFIYRHDNLCAMTKDNKNNDDDDDKVIRFPSKAEQSRKQKQQEKQWRAEYKAEKKAGEEPFFNAHKIPPATRNLVCLFLAVQVILSVFFDAGGRLQFFFDFGFVPAYYTGGVDWSITALLGPFTYSYIHSGFMHLAFNSVMMLAMGTFMENTFGTKRTLIFFIFSGLFGAALHFAFNPFSTSPVVGASGNISGLFGVVFLVMYERGMMGDIGKHGPIPLICIWIVILSITGLIGGNVAWLAHLGGYLGGVGLYYALKKGFVRF